ncbi:GIN domain-containing protein [Maribacter sp. 2210JD10-5]|uniref:GIN domain-containing protein n=1 Tax=Maribacter sp. 2210JD10-5 TaxID=3386272 RepID=UPI0039BC8358
MNRVILVLLIGILGFQANAQRKPKIKGNKNVVEVREDLPPFHAIQLDDDLEVVLQKASNEGYTIEADDNLIDVLKFKVSDSVLVISSFYNIISKKKLNITVYYTELTDINMKNGEISMQDVISSDRLYVYTSGTSRLELNATADIIDISMEGISSGDFNLASDSLNLTLKDRIDVRVYATGEKNNVYMYKNASAKFEGTSDFFTAKLYGNSNLKAEKLEAQSAMIISQDSPSARVNVLSDFQLSSRGSSRTSLYGNPKITILDFLDTSRLDKEKD